ELKVEVEGVCFTIWVVEERGRQRLEVVLDGDREDEGSLVIAAQNTEDGRDGGSVDGGANSGEDEDSGNDMDVDMSKDAQHGGRIEVVCDSTMCGQMAKEGDKILFYVVERTKGLDEVENSVAIDSERKEDFNLMDPIPDSPNSGLAVMGCSPAGQLVLGCSPADPF
ncbi:hypothetical protein A2U01_0041723, partial [Trifolium medium]|nr:hypothetical protein [Trifolium medium]